MRDERRRVVAGGAVAVLLILAVASVWAAGPTHWSAPRWRIAPPPLPVRTPQPQPSASRPGVLNPTVPAEAQKILTLLAAIVVCLALLAIAYRLLRRIRVTQRVRRDARAVRIDVLPAGELAAEPEPAPAPIVRGLARALQILDEDRSADDAIVQAWLGLEEASVASGAGRRPAETPGEYAARVISRFAADRDAVTVLLGLYQGVRFGTRHADAGSVRIARDCVRRLASSWREDATAGRR